MSNLNYNEVGQKIRVDAGKDISASVPTLILLPEYGPKKEITSGVTIPVIDFVDGDVTLAANEYIEYSTIDNDLDYAGRWKKKAKLTYSDSNIEQTDYEKFRVMP